MALDNMSLTHEATPALAMDFYDALKQAAAENRITRLAWDDPDVYVFVAIMGDGNLKIKNSTGLHNLIINYADIIATDWVVV